MENMTDRQIFDLIRNGMENFQNTMEKVQKDLEKVQGLLDKAMSSNKKIASVLDELVLDLHEHEEESIILNGIVEDELSDVDSDLSKSSCESHLEFLVNQQQIEAKTFKAGLSSVVEPAVHDIGEHLHKVRDWSYFPVFDPGILSVQDCVSCHDIVSQGVGKSMGGYLRVRGYTNHDGAGFNMPISILQAFVKLAAEAYAKRLVDYDLNSATRITVCDDQSDYYEMEGSRCLSSICVGQEVFYRDVMQTWGISFAEFHTQAINLSQGSQWLDDTRLVPRMLLKPMELMEIYAKEDGHHIASTFIIHDEIDVGLMIIHDVLNVEDEVISDAPYTITYDSMRKFFAEYKIDYIIHRDNPCELLDSINAYALAKMLRDARGLEDFPLDWLIGSPWEVFRDMIKIFNVSLVVQEKGAECDDFLIVLRHPLPLLATDSSRLEEFDPFWIATFDAMIKARQRIMLMNLICTCSNELFLHSMTQLHLKIVLKGKHVFLGRAMVRDYDGFNGPGFFCGAFDSILALVRDYDGFNGPGHTLRTRCP